MFKKKNAIAEIKPQGQLEWYSEVPRSIRLRISEIVDEEHALEQPEKKGLFARLFGKRG